jgi:signal transduction histidine kinase
VYFRRSGYFPQFSFHEVLNQKVGSNSFTNKVVWIGEDLGKSLKEYIKTPLSKDPSSMTVTEFHAHALETIVQDKGISFIPQKLTLILSLFLVLLVIYGAFHSQPFVSFISLFGIVSIALIMNFILFLLTNWQFDLAHPILTVSISYYILLPYRLLLEQRKTWEAQQKNTLLSQVEELKTNFISMMSHDLKTPIARIQGMTDIILKDSVILSPKQREAIDFIRSSADDLLRVLSAILSYAKIESDGVVLNKTSRDINKILEEVILRHQFLAKMKSIQIIFEPETLFPILVDGDIMKQVFSNLIENAIKYSPENTKILVVTEELGDGVRIQVSDQGFGISPEELPFIFSKFFRGSKAKTSPIKGSGLGLYLTKYFIELHGGKISVESEVNLGTTFTVDLPIEDQS